MHELIFLVPIALTAAIFVPWFVIEDKMKRRKLAHLIAHPEEVESIARSGPDDDGYNRLQVKTRDGKELVIIGV